MSGAFTRSHAGRVPQQMRGSWGSGNDIFGTIVNFKKDYYEYIQQAILPGVIG